MNDMRDIVTEERAGRDADPRYVGGNFPNGNVVGRWLVLQTSKGGPVRSYLSSNGVAFGKVTHDRLYKDFKAYVQKEVKDGNLDLEGLELEKSLKQMERSLKNSGLDKGSAKVTKSLRDMVSKEILANMDRIKDNIADGLEVAFLSRELPDRLLVWRAITDDNQVKEAIDVITDRDRLSSGGTIADSKMERLKRSKNRETLVSGGKVVPAEERAKSYGNVLAPPEFRTAEGIGLGIGKR